MPMPAGEKSNMTREQFQYQIDYSTAMHIIKEMAATGIITEKEFAKINKMYIEKYKPVFENQPALNA